VSRRTLAPGETFVILTDGFLDAVGPGGDRFGDERLLDTLSRDGGAPAALVERLTRTVVGFTGNVPQADDLTCLAVSPT